MNQDISKNQPEQNKDGESVRELAHRHMQDQNHETTDEELKNARLETSVPENVTETPIGNDDVQQMKKDIDKEVEDDDQEIKKEITTPWDTLGS